MARMKRLQISIEPELDAALGRAARTQGVSKAAVVRRLVAEQLTPLPPLEEDALWDFVGKSRGRPDDSASVDDVVYPR
jgi:Ribbon-helix-helix protein, copG family